MNKYDNIKQLFNNLDFIKKVNNDILNLEKNKNFLLFLSKLDKNNNYIVKSNNNNIKKNNDYSYLYLSLNKLSEDNYNDIISELLIIIKNKNIDYKVVEIIINLCILNSKYLSIYIKILNILNNDLNYNIKNITEIIYKKEKKIINDLNNLLSLNDLNDYDNLCKYNKIEKEYININKLIYNYDNNILNKLLNNIKNTNKGNILINIYVNIIYEIKIHYKLQINSNILKDITETVDKKTKFKILDILEL